jgi:hypothetical protein
MTYVGTQIGLWIMMAVVFGFAVGWLARGRRGLAVKRSTKRRF